jgi:hypothetical protein
MILSRAQVYSAVWLATGNANENGSRLWCDQWWDHYLLALGNCINVITGAWLAAQGSKYINSSCVRASLINLSNS